MGWEEGERERVREGRGAYEDDVLDVVEGHGGVMGGVVMLSRELEGIVRRHFDGVEGGMGIWMGD